MIPYRAPQPTLKWLHTTCSCATCRNHTSGIRMSHTYGSEVWAWGLSHSCGRSWRLGSLMVLGIDWILSPIKHVDPRFSRPHFDDLVSQCHDIHRPLPKPLAVPSDFDRSASQASPWTLTWRAGYCLSWTHSSFRTCLLVWLYHLCFNVHDGFVLSIQVILWILLGWTFHLNLIRTFLSDAKIMVSLRRSVQFPIDTTLVTMFQFVFHVFPPCFTGHLEVQRRRSFRNPQILQKSHWIMLDPAADALS